MNAMTTSDGSVTDPEASNTTGNKMAEAEVVGPLKAENPGYRNLIPWRPGQGGGGRGRPRGLVRLVREKTNNGADLVNIMLSIAHGTIPPVLNGDGDVLAPDLPGEASVSDRQKAVEWLADRGFGRPDATSAVNTWEVVARMVAEMIEAIDSEPMDPEVALRLKHRWHEIIQRY